MPWRKFVQDKLTVAHKILLDDMRIINYMGETEAILVRVTPKPDGTWSWFVVKIPPGLVFLELII